MPAVEKKKVVVIGGANLGQGQRTFYRRKFCNYAKQEPDPDNGGVTAPFGKRIPRDALVNEKELLDGKLAHLEDEDARDKNFRA